MPSIAGLLCCDRSPACGVVFLGRALFNNREWRNGGEERVGKGPGRVGTGKVLGGIWSHGASLGMDAHSDTESRTTLDQQTGDPTSLC